MSARSLRSRVRIPPRSGGRAGATLARAGVLLAAGLVARASAQFPLPVTSALAAPGPAFEAGPVNALLLLPDGRLVALDTENGRVEVLSGALAAGRPGSGGRAGAGFGAASGAGSSAAATASGIPWSGGAAGGAGPASGASPALHPTASIFCGLAPVAAVVDPDDPGRLFVSNQLSDSVSVVDLSLGAVVATIPVGDEPAGLAIDSGRLFVACARAPAEVPAPGATNPGEPVEGVVAVFSLDEPFPRLALVPLGAVAPRDVAAHAGSVRAIPLHSGNRTSLIDETATTGLGLGQLVADAFDAPFITNPVLAKPELAWPAYARGWVLPQAGRIVRDDEYPALTAELPDRDVVAFGAVSLAEVVTATRGVGTTLFDIERDPVTGDFWVANTDARNRTRFEPALRGAAVANRVTIVGADGAVKQVVSLDPPATATGHAQPAVLAFAHGPAGAYAFVACLGVAQVVVLDPVTGAMLHELDVGEIPSGLAVDDARGILYVLTRGDRRITAWRLGTWAPLGSVALPPEAQTPAVARGRRELYDARASTGHGNGTMSCASCHVFGHDDRLAWDLGDPGGSFAYHAPETMTGLAGYEGQIVTLPGVPILNPLKGPMVTQSLRGLLDPDTKDDLPGHWRGDRPALQMFAGAFDTLLGGTRRDPAAMQDLLAFLRALRHPPNPLEPVDRAYIGLAAQGRDLFGMNPDVAPKEYVAGSGFHCIDCHKGDFAGGTDYTGSRPTVSAGSFTQLFNTAQLRGQYEKDFKALGGFGSLHDGAVDGVRGFMDFHVPNGGLPTFSNLTDPDKDAIAAFVRAWDSGISPAMGRQFTLAPATLADADAALGLLEAQARPPADAIDLVVKGYRFDGQGVLLHRGGVYAQDPADGQWRYRFDTGPCCDGQPSAGSLGTWADRPLLELVVSLGVARYTFTAVPRGTGTRLGIDRDGDGLPDGMEAAAGCDPLRPDSDGDGYLDGAEPALGGNPANFDVALPDSSPPVVLELRALEIGSHAATLCVLTDEPAHLHVTLGTAPGLGDVADFDGPAGRACLADVALVGLPGGTSLYAQVAATDRDGHVALADVGFTTRPLLLHVGDITLAKSDAGGGALALTARVLVLDAFGQPRAGVPVRGFWAGAIGGQAWEQEATSAADGWAAFALAPFAPTGTGTVAFSPVYIGSPKPNKPWFVGKGGDVPVFFHDQSSDAVHYRELSVP